MPCKPSTLCSALLPSQKKKKDGDLCLAQVVEPRPRPHKSHSPEAKSSRATRTRSSLDKAKLKLGDGDGTRVAQSSGSRGVLVDGSSSYSSIVTGAHGIGDPRAFHRTSSQVHREFLRVTAGASEGFFSCSEELPKCNEALAQFTGTYPRFRETRVVDELREQEYLHLEEEESMTCLDYCGFGLFSQVQQWETEDDSSSFSSSSSSFGLVEISANLWSHALFGAAPESTMEGGLRKRIMQFLNIPEAEYSMVFTASRGSTFKLLADAYPWERSCNLVTMYDYESESVGWMEQRAKERGAKVSRAGFKWPSLRVCSRELKKELITGARKRKTSRQGPDHSSVSWLERVSSRQQHNSDKVRTKGLFVFPAQSRVSGAKYSYQWMSLAQQNKWHVLLDASALGPKDMDSLGLSLFRPDFIIASFYRLFGGDPSGFGCLFIKNSVAQSIQDPSGAPVTGMVRIVPYSPSYGAYSGSSMSEQDSEVDESQMMSSFSGPMLAYKDLPDFQRLPGTLEENDSSTCEDNNETASVGDFSRSPIFSEDGNETVVGMEVGPSPMGSVSCASMSEEGFSGPMQEETIQSLFNQAVQGKKDLLHSASSRSRIRGLCSGLLHRHTGRVGNSADSVGEEAFQSNKDLELVKSSEAQKAEVLDLNKPSFGATMSPIKHSSTHECRENGIKEDVTDRLVVVVRKVRKEHSFPASEELSLDFHVKEHGNHFTRVKAGEIPQQMDDTWEEKSNFGGLETIAEIETESETCRSHEQGQAAKVAGLNQGGDNSLFVGSNGREQQTEITCSQKDSAICRETEKDFRLLDRRNGERFFIGLGDDSFRRSMDSSIGNGLCFEQNSEVRSDGGLVDQVVVEEPQLLCRGLDHADALGLNKTSFRLRYLINWLISSLLRLRHYDTDLSLVKIYGPQVRYDRGASIAFNLFDNQGKMLHPELVRMLADQTNISLGLGFLRNINFSTNVSRASVPGFIDANSEGQQSKPVNLPSRVEVVTAALGLLSDFKDVYKMWVFVARFLDPDFVASGIGHFSLEIDG